MKVAIISSGRSNKTIEVEKFLLNQHSSLQSIKNLLDIQFLDADVLIILGGDGFMLRALHTLIQHRKNISAYGINCGNVGFLLNEFTQDDILIKIKQATQIILSPLQVCLRDRTGEIKNVYAINEISLIRQTYQAVNIKISIDDKIKIQNLVGDGVLFSTSAGSAAYNFSAGGVILPLESNLLTITAINPFRPRKWKYAILNPKSVVELEILDGAKRPVLACADFQQFYFTEFITARLDSEVTYSILFDAESDLASKLMNEQFVL